MPLLIGLTFDLKPKYSLKNKPPACRAGRDDFLAEFDTEETISSIENALAKCGSSVLKIGSAKSILEILPRLQCNIIFNIAEGEDGRNRESQVPAILEAVDIPYVGSDALTLAISLDKVFAKRIFAYHNIPTPRYFECKNERNIVVPKGLNFPLIVKPRYEGSAKGITPDSKVSRFNELKKQVERIVRIYRQPALVEEFISGREFTVGIIGNEPRTFAKVRGENPLVFPVVQRHLEAKTNLSSHIFEKCGYDKSRLRYQELPEIESDLELEIKRLSIEAFRAIECRDFARVDFRIGSCASTQGNEKIYVLEINPLPSLATDDYFALSAESLGMSYDEMINMILEAAVKRYECLQKTYTHIQNIAR